MLSKEAKEQLSAQYGAHPGDTGSVEVQVAMLTERINRLSSHLTGNNNDHHYCHVSYNYYYNYNYYNYYHYHHDYLCYHEHFHNH